MHWRALLTLDRSNEQLSYELIIYLSSKLAELNNLPYIFTEQTDKVSYKVAKLAHINLIWNAPQRKKEMLALSFILEVDRKEIF